jgi:hypothetical protein
VRPHRTAREEVDAVHPEPAVPGELAEADSTGVDLDALADDPDRIQRRFAVRMRPPAFHVRDAGLAARKGGFQIPDPDLELGDLGAEAA